MKFVTGLIDYHGGPHVHHDQRMSPNTDMKM